MNFITDVIYEYGLWAMFLLILLEYACFPVSSEIVLPFSGAMASLQHISFFLIIPISVLAGLIGTSICYSIGRFGGAPILNKITVKFPKSKTSIDKSYEKFEQYGTTAVCFGRVIPLCRTYIAFVAGAVKMNYLHFIFSSSLGIIVWNIILIGTGYLLRENWSNVGEYYNRYKQVIIPIVIVIIGIALLRFLPIKRKNRSNT